MKPYADTNLFTRLYLELEESPLADALAGQARFGKADRLPISWLHRIELANAFELHVFHGRQPGHVRVTSEQAAIAWESFRGDAETGDFLAVVRLPEALLEDEAAALARRFTARNGFRSYDLLHVASARVLGCDVFWSFDERALRLAKLAGLKVGGRRIR